jgi:hypothetical protein
MLDEIIGRANKRLEACLAASSSTWGLLSGCCGEVICLTLQFRYRNSACCGGYRTRDPLNTTPREMNAGRNRRFGELRSTSSAGFVGMGLFKRCWDRLASLRFNYWTSRSAVDVMFIGTQSLYRCATDTAVLRLVAGSGIVFVAMVAREGIRPNVRLGEWTRD